MYCKNNGVARKVRDVGSYKEEMKNRRKEHAIESKQRETKNEINSRVLFSAGQRRTEIITRGRNNNNLMTNGERKSGKIRRTPVLRVIGMCMGFFH